MATLNILMAANFLAAFLAATATTVAAKGAEAVKGKAWKVAEDFDGKKARANLSAAVCSGEGEHRVCYAVNDEERYLQTFSIKGGVLEPGQRLILHKQKKETATDRWDVEKNKPDDAQPDMEAAALSEDGVVYVVGSHGRSRKHCLLRPSSFTVYRFPAAENGVGDRSEKREATGLKTSNRLRSLIASDPVLGEYADQCLSNNGVTIEGAAIIGDDLLLGFRAPVTAKGAVVLRVSRAALFDGPPDAPGLSGRIHRLKLDRGYGVRGMDRVEGGVLILAGPVGDDEAPPTIWRWSAKDGDDPRKIATLADEEGWKGEGLLALDRERIHSRGWRALVFFDDKKNGKPHAYEIRDPR